MSMVMVNAFSTHRLKIVTLAVLAVILVAFFTREFLVDVKYNYDNMTNRQYVYGDLSGPRVGDPAIDFEAHDLEGNVVRLSDYLGKIVVLTTGSGTCPMYVGVLGGMNSLADNMRDKVEFLVLYVREAHPGDNFPPHKLFSQKVEQAKITTREENENRLVVVDGLDGEIHQSYGSWPNMAYLVDQNGVIRLRQKWTDPAALEIALNMLLLDPKADLTGVKSVEMVPDVELLTRVFRRSGDGGWSDFIMSFPGMIFHTVDALLSE